MNMTNNKIINVALADDHSLLRKALAALIDSFDTCKVIYQADDGKHLIDLAQREAKPDVILLDLNMPNMDGYATARWFQENMPEVRILMLTMYDSESTLIRLLQAGVKGFLKKDVHPSELRCAIQTVVETGFYYSSHTTGKLANLFRMSDNDNIVLQKMMLTEQEIKFIQLACTELTYKEMAFEMKLNPRAIDNLRDCLFEKLDVKSRVGLAIYAIKKGVVTF